MLWALSSTNVLCSVLSSSAFYTLAIAPLGLAQRGCWYVHVKRWSVALLRALLLRACWAFCALLVHARWACFALRVVGTCALSVPRVVGTFALSIPRVIGTCALSVLRSAWDQQTRTCMSRHIPNSCFAPRGINKHALACCVASRTCYRDRAHS